MSAVTVVQVQGGPIKAARNPPLKEGIWKVLRMRRLRLLCASGNRLADGTRKVGRDAGGPDGNGAGRPRDASRKRATTQRPDPMAQMTYAA